MLANHHTTKQWQPLPPLVFASEPPLLSSGGLCDFLQPSSALSTEMIGKKCPPLCSQQFYRSSKNQDTQIRAVKSVFDRADRALVKGKFKCDPWAFCWNSAFGPKLERSSINFICLINMSVLTQPSLSSLELFSSLTLPLERQVDCLCYAGRKGSQQLLIVALLRILDNQTVVTIVDTQKVIKLFSKPPSSFVSLSTFLKN